MSKIKTIHISPSLLGVNRRISSSEMEWIASIFEASLKDALAASLGQNNKIADQVLVSSTKAEVTLTMPDYAFFLNDGTKPHLDKNRIGETIPVGDGEVRVMSVESIAEGDWYNPGIEPKGFLDQAIDYASTRVRSVLEERDNG